MIAGVQIISLTARYDDRGHLIEIAHQAGGQHGAHVP